MKINISPNYTRYYSNIAVFRGNKGINTQDKKIELAPINIGPPMIAQTLQFPLNQIMQQKINLEKTRPNLLAHTCIDYKDWLNQFETESEKSLALKMLQNYMYIDINGARSAFKKLYSDLEDKIDMNKTNFAIFGTAKSGSVMGYLFRQANKIRSKGMVRHEFTNTEHIPADEKFLNSTQISDVKFNEQQRLQGKENIVIVDDMLGDGDSFIEYLTQDVRSSLMQYKNIYFVTLIKDPDGEKRIKNNFPDLNINFITAQEIHKYDSPENKSFTDYEKQEITKMLKKYGNKICKELVKKYNRSKLLVSFEWNTPGNTPMIFNITNSEWNGLFHRFNGLEENDVSPKYNFYN